MQKQQQQNELKVLSLFSGIGAFERALENMHTPYELVAYCEIDKYASRAYSILHDVPETKNLGDITKIDVSKLPTDIDLLTYGFPCQDISVAGRGKGLVHEGTQTRSGLVWDAHKIIEATKPKIAICENVKNLVGKKFTTEFKAILDNLEELGYTNYWQVLNACDYGIPQNRERVFIVSIRKDLKKKFEFPAPVPLNLRLKDLLEPVVEEKYYINPKQIKNIVFTKKNDGIVIVGNTKSGGEKSAILSPNGIVSCLTATCYKQPKQIIQIANIHPTATRDNPNQGRVYDTNGLAPTLNCKGGGGLEAHIMEVANSENYMTNENVDFPFRIRKLTPTEYFRCMGFNDDDVNKLRDAGISNTQLYKMAGNSIVVDVLMAIFKEL